jgi:hypothetical protein
MYNVPLKLNYFLDSECIGGKRDIGLNRFVGNGTVGKLTPVLVTFPPSQRLYMRWVYQVWF